MNREERLTLFKSEILDKGVESTLPCNLSVEWLKILIEQADDLYNAKEGADIEELLCAVLHIVSGKEGPGRTVISINKELLFDYMQQYRVELGVEFVSRHTNMKVKPATLKTIFTKRTFEFLVTDD